MSAASRRNQTRSDLFRAHLGSQGSLLVYTKLAFTGEILRISTRDPFSNGSTVQTDFPTSQTRRKNSSPPTGLFFKCRVSKRAAGGLRVYQEGASRGSWKEAAAKSLQTGKCVLFHFKIKGCSNAVSPLALTLSPLQREILAF